MTDTNVTPLLSISSRSCEWFLLFGIKALEHEQKRERERMREGRCYQPSAGLALELEVAMAKVWRRASVELQRGPGAMASGCERWRRFPPLLRSLRSVRVSVGGVLWQPVNLVP